MRELLSVKTQHAETVHGEPPIAVAVFQPHLFSRTRDLCAEFGRALMSADAAVVTEIEALAKDQENVRRFLADATIRKVIVVPQKLVNIVAQ